MPPSRSARAAPASTRSVPCAGLAYFSHSLKLECLLLRGAKRVPTASPAHARGTTPASRPEAITVLIPAEVAMSAATTFERMPPEPSGEVACPISSTSSASGSSTRSTSVAPGSMRGSAV